jgi:bacterioferritin-associated ferredoxin
MAYKPLCYCSEKDAKPTRVRNRVMTMKDGSQMIFDGSQCGNCKQLAGEWKEIDAKL